MAALLRSLADAAERDEATCHALVKGLHIGLAAVTEQDPGSAATVAEVLSTALAAHDAAMAPPPRGLIAAAIADRRRNVGGRPRSDRGRNAALAVYVAAVEQFIPRGRRKAAMLEVARQFGLSVSTVREIAREREDAARHALAQPPTPERLAQLRVRIEAMAKR